MSSATLRLTLIDVTLDELHEHLNNLRSAGWGKTHVDWAVNPKDCSNRVELKMFRSLPEKTK